MNKWISLYKPHRPEESGTILFRRTVNPEFYMSSRNSLGMKVKTRKAILQIYVATDFGLRLYVGLGSSRDG